jgi:cellulose synthase/poly-beta-1,6-N-acetylglucosamine synthase-like glycosyltransferase
MISLINPITYIFLFISLNFEVFLLITYFENRGKIAEEDKLLQNGIKKYPSVTVIVPCWNEQNTVSKTIYSLLNLDYPKDKLKIMIVNDGSTDNTWENVQKFKSHPQIALHSKENGGKHSALNYGLKQLQTELVCCLDADSYVHKDALKHIVVYFQDKTIMAVAPSVKLWKPKGILQKLQKVEYGFGIFTRKMFHYMQAVYITPGPLSTFRREVFENLGGYRKAHNTEDIEIALRMQKNGYKIAHAHNAIVYTVAPHKLRPLLKQRVRWSHGFIKNAFDYRDMLFSKKHGNLGLFVLPMAAISVTSVLTIATISVINFTGTLSQWYIKWSAIGFHFGHFNFDWFFINTELLAFVSLVTAIGSISMILISRKMAEGSMRLGLDLIYYLTLYMFIAPLWMARALFNAVFSIKTSWR